MVYAIPLRGARTPFSGVPRVPFRTQQKLTHDADTSICGEGTCIFPDSVPFLWVDKNSRRDSRRTGVGGYRPRRLQRLDLLSQPDGLGVGHLSRLCRSN